VFASFTADGCSQIATTHMMTGGVVVIAIIGSTGDGEGIMVDVALVPRGNILLGAHSHCVLGLLAMAVKDRVDEERTRTHRVVSNFIANRLHRHHPSRERFLKA
jgi:hypothetical protein